MSSTEPWRIPHWLTPVWDDQPVSQRTRRCRPSRSHPSIVGQSPERVARTNTSWATPSSCTNTMPGTSVRAADFARRRATVAVRRSNHTSSSIAISDETIALMTASPITITTAVPKPSTVTPGSSSSTSSTRRASSTIAPMPRVSTEMGTTTIDRSGHTTPFTSADDEAGEEGVAGAVDVEAVEHGGEHPQRERRGDDDHDRPAEDLGGRRPVLRGADERVGCGHGLQLRSIGRAWAGSNRSFPGSEHTQPVGRARGRQLVGEAVHGCVEPGRSAHADGGVGAPVHGHHELWAHQFDGAGRPLGVEVALADGAAPAPDRYERHVDRTERAHRLEQVGVTGEVHAGVAGAHHVSDGVGLTRLCGPRPDGWTAGTVSMVSGPKVVVSPARVSRTWPKPLRRRKAAAPAGTIIATSASNRRSEGTCRWSRWTCEISTRSGRSSVATSTRWWRRRWARRGVSAGSVSTRTPASSIITLAWPSQRTRAGWSDVMCAA